MKTIHEYLADEAVLQKGTRRALYQQMILDETMGLRLNNLTNNFNVSLLKNRIVMMTKPKSKTWAKSKLLIALPVIVILLFMLKPPVSYAGTRDQQKQKQEGGVPFFDTTNHVYLRVEESPTYPGGDEARIKFLLDNIRYPKKAKKNHIQGNVFVSFIVRADGSLTDFKILRGIGRECDKEALRAIKKMPKWIPGKDKGKPVDVSFVLPIQFSLASHKKAEPEK